MAIFFSAATAAGAFGGLLARGIMQMNGLGGRPGWAWIFIIEGILTLVVAFSAFYFMQDYPETATFLTEPERKEVERRLETDRDFLADEYNVKFIWQALTDWKIYVFSFIGTGLALPVYSVSLFMPTIVKSLHYTDATAQLMTTPPYIIACAVCITGKFSSLVGTSEERRRILMLCRRLFGGQNKDAWAFHDYLLHDRVIMALHYVLFYWPITNDKST
jgi:MFS family permease